MLQSLLAVVLVTVLVAVVVLLEGPELRLPALVVVVVVVWVSCSTGKLP